MRDNALLLVGIILMIRLSEEGKGFVDVSLGSGGEIRGAGPLLGAGLRGGLGATPLGWLSRGRNLRKEQGSENIEILTYHGDCQIVKKGLIRIPLVGGHVCLTARRAPFAKSEPDEHKVMTTLGGTTSRSQSGSRVFRERSGGGPAQLRRERITAPGESQTAGSGAACRSVRGA